MKRSRGWMTLLIFSASLCDMPIAVAQVPPHEPGTICFTKKFWCWANPPGRPKARCTCPSPYGSVPGVLG